MEYVLTFDTKAPDGPVAWSQHREAEGWTGVALPDHIAQGDLGWWHPFAAMGAVAASTERLTLTHAFTNNLMRSPVELAQAAMTLHALSQGRFEIGLGAGWAEDEMRRIGLPYPSPKERAQRFYEAALIVTSLVRGGCRHDGAHYTVDVGGIGPRTAGAPPRVSASLGGPWTIEHIAPLVDRIEINPLGSIVRAGAMDLGKIGAVGPADVHAMVDRARAANPDAEVGLTVMVAAGDDPAVTRLSAGFGDGFGRGLAGSAAQVADALRRFERYGVDRLTLMAPVAGTAELLAPELF